MNKLTFEKLRKKNHERNRKHFPACKNWKATDWGLAIAGETGELCNFIKKMKRDGVDHTPAIKKELADIVAYVDLCADFFGIDLGEAVTLKFNEVSFKRKIRITL